MAEPVLKNNEIFNEKTINLFKHESTEQNSIQAYKYPTKTGLDDLDEIIEIEGNTKSKDITNLVTKKKKMNVHICEDLTDEDSVETTALKQNCDNGSSNKPLTIFGTIQRGKNKNEKVKVLLNMSQEELEMLEDGIINKTKCGRGLNFGIHIFLWSVICLPVSFVITAVYSFYIGTITWYSIFSLFSEGKSLVLKIFVPVALIALYPFLIILTSLGLGLYAGIKQLSCSWNSWLEEFVDYEKGFYGWLCNSLDISECSPYEVVILSGLPKN